MKAFERVLLYSVLAVLVFYVFLIDSKVESKVAIQEEIRARSISIINDAGQEVISLCTIEDGGAIIVANKAGTCVAGMGTDKDGGKIVVSNKNGIPVGAIGIYEDGGAINISNKAGTFVAYMSTNKYDGGEISIANKAGTFVATMGAPEDYGIIAVLNKHGKVIDTLP